MHIVVSSWSFGEAQNRQPGSQPFWSYEITVPLFRSPRVTLWRHEVSTQMDVSGGTLPAAETVILMDSSGASDAWARGPARVPPRNPRSKPPYQTSFPVLPAARRNCTRYSRPPTPAGAYHPNREPTRIPVLSAGMRSAPSRQTGPDPRSPERGHVSARRLPGATRPLRVPRPAPPRSSRELHRPLRP
jgi:hypothetical protein